jgi:hypothetical protein
LKERRTIFLLPTAEVGRSILTFTSDGNDIVFGKLDLHRQLSWCPRSTSTDAAQSIGVDRDVDQGVPISGFAN